MENRVNLGKAAPGLYQSIVNLDRLASELAASAGIAEGLTHLLRLRASQLNQCAYCVRLHTRDALASGEPSDRISVLPAWRETQYFNDKERAAFALVEAVDGIDWVNGNLVGYRRTVKKLIRGPIPYSGAKIPCSAKIIPCSVKKIPCSIC